MGFLFLRPLATVSKYKYQIELRKYVMQSIWDLGLGKPVLRYQIDKKTNPASAFSQIISGIHR